MGMKEKAKQSNPAVVEISQSVYSCCSSDLWLYSLEKCKVAQPVHINSGLTDTFECQHIKEAKNSCD